MVARFRLRRNEPCDFRPEPGTNCANSVRLPVATKRAAQPSGEASPLDQDHALSPETLGPLLILGIVLTAGAVGGWAAQLVRLPRVTGNIVAGVILATTLFHDAEIARLLQPLSTFAISLIAVTAGGHFSYRRLHNSMRRVLFIGCFEVVGAVLFVYFALTLLPLELPVDETWPVALVLACLAASTAPATTVALIRENHAKGPFVKTLLAAVSVDSSLCIILFAFVHSLLAAFYTHGEVHMGLAAGLGQAAWKFFGSAALGVGLGAAVTPLFAHHRIHNFSTLLIAILFAEGLSFFFNFSTLLTCLFFGGYLGNSTRENERQLDALAPAEPLLYTAFFTLAGVGIHIDLLLVAGIPCLLYVIARGSGKGFGAWTGAWASGASPRIARSIPYGFLPQAGVALGLAVVFEGDARIPTEISSFVGTLVLAAVTMNEIVGPLFTRFALTRANEVGLDRPRLVEFLDEEYIEPNLKAKDKWDAIHKLVDFYVKTHRLKGADRERIYQSIVDREQQYTTAVGDGAALPHGRVETKTEIDGVMGICHDGVDFDAPDGEPVHIIVLIVTPKDNVQRHLEVLGSLSAMVSDPVARSKLLVATDANEAWEVLESEEARDFNYFLESEPEQTGGPEGRA